MKGKKKQMKIFENPGQNQLKRTNADDQKAS